MQGKPKKCLIQPYFCSSLKPWSISFSEICINRLSIYRVQQNLNHCNFLFYFTAFLFKQAKNLGAEEGDEVKKEQPRQTKMKMLMSWLPLLCRASNGTDAPVLSTNERAELERVLEETIEMLEQDDEQEKVLSLWLHHYTYCPSSDWPNLHACYARWCSASRKLLLLHWRALVILSGHRYGHALEIVFFEITNDESALRQEKRSSETDLWSKNGLKRFRLG